MTIDKILAVIREYLESRDALGASRHPGDYLPAKGRYDKALTALRDVL